MKCEIDWWHVKDNEKAQHKVWFKQKHRLGTGQDIFGLFLSFSYQHGLSQNLLSNSDSFWSNLPHTHASNVTLVISSFVTYAC